MENNNQIKTSLKSTLKNITDVLPSQLLLFESTIENDSYLIHYTETKHSQTQNNFLTHFEGKLTNADDILKSTLIYFESVYREDPYLKSFKDYKKESLEEFLE